MSGGERPRLAPWSGEDGKPCYLVTDDDCRLSRLADRMEAEQLAIGVRLLDFASDLVTDGSTHPHEMRFLARRLSEALRDALRVADSRGDRLPRVDRAAAPPSDPDDRRSGRNERRSGTGNR
ncbi:hypothetical protein MTQ01_12755 [Streptomyces sp. XM4193]|uniref:hypothetical protein n=1 Tax=Streptomyces sp. XM4193 TaxID=2929782 RepID=UPI001FFC236F|nr:hypothetical protein [Streptomyces sp. XM4193]MCK1796869.1 hypothetical protein [Streptomyces sp. XM4193]